MECLGCLSKAAEIKLLEQWLKDKDRQMAETSTVVGRLMGLLERFMDREDVVKHVDEAKMDAATVWNRYEKMGF